MIPNEMCFQSPVATVDDHVLGGPGHGRDSFLPHVIRLGFPGDRLDWITMQRGCKGLHGRRPQDQCGDPVDTIFLERKSINSARPVRIGS